MPTTYLNLQQHGWQGIREYLFGIKTMLDFGGVVAGNAPTFTFPLAYRPKADLAK